MLRKPYHEEVAGETNTARYQSFDDEDPPPALVASRTICHGEQGSKKTVEGSSKDGGTEEDCIATEELILLVVRSYKIGAAGYFELINQRSQVVKK